MYADEDIYGTVKPDESMWTYSDGVININLQKMIKGEVNKILFNLLLLYSGRNDNNSFKYTSSS